MLAELCTQQCFVLYPPTCMDFSYFLAGNLSAVALGYYHAHSHTHTHILHSAIPTIFVSRVSSRIFSLGKRGLIILIISLGSELDHLIFFLSIF